MFSVAFPAQQTLEVQNYNASVYISINYDSSASLGIIASKYMCMTKYSFDSYDFERSLIYTFLWNILS